MISFFLFYIIYLFLGLKTCLTLLSLSACPSYSIVATIRKLGITVEEVSFSPWATLHRIRENVLRPGTRTGKIQIPSAVWSRYQGQIFFSRKGEKNKDKFSREKNNNSKLQWKRGYYGWQFCWFQFSQKLLWYLSLREQMWHTWLYCTETNSCWAFEFWGNRYETLDPTRIWLFWSQTVSLIMPFTFSRFTLLLVFQY